MFVLYADKNKLTVRERETVISGGGVYQAQFGFSEDWNGLERTAVFQSGYRSWPVPLDSGGECSVPREALTQPGLHLFCGVRGRQGEDVVLSTAWADLGIVLNGTAPGGESRPPAPELWREELDKKGDRLAYTADGQLGLYSGDRKLSSVSLENGGGVLLKLGHGLKKDGDTVAVEAVSSFSGDNTLPATAALVQAQVGNIKALLETI